MNLEISDKNWFRLCELSIDLQLNELEEILLDIASENVDLSKERGLDI